MQFGSRRHRRRAAEAAVYFGFAEKVVTVAIVRATTRAPMRFARANSDSSHHIPGEKLKKTGMILNIKTVIVAILFFAAIIGLYADTITVTNTSDSRPGSLRQALADANDGDTINFAVTGTIGLTSGELLVDKSITISGPGADQLAVDGNATSRVFHVGSNTSVVISGLTIRNGSGGGGNFHGAGIYNDHATLIVDSCALAGNTADAGGAIYNDGSGGAATLGVSSSAFSNNSATIEGGALFNSGLLGFATLRVFNSTLSGNSAQTGGGGIRNAVNRGIATVEVNNSTFSGNSGGAAGGGSVHNGGPGVGTAEVDLADTILLANVQDGNIINDPGGTIISHGYNLGSDDAGGYLTGPGDQVNTDPTLGPLQDNGGPTFTHELLPGSPAIDAGAPTFNPPPFYDQRGPGFDRVAKGRIDIGSFEVQGATPTPTPIATPTPTPTPPEPIRAEIRREIRKIRKGLSALREIEAPHEASIRRWLRVRLKVLRARLAYPTDEVLERIDNDITDKGQTFLGKAAKRKILARVHAQLTKLQADG